MSLFGWEVVSMFKINLKGCDRDFVKKKIEMKYCKQQAETAEIRHVQTQLYLMVL